MSQTGPDQPSVDDVKAKMKEALDRKHAGEHAGQAHVDAGKKPGQPHGKSGGVERFQRKSGG